MPDDTRLVLIWDFDGTLGYREGMWSDVLAKLAKLHRPGGDYEAGRFRPYLQSGFPWHDWQTVRPPGSSADAWWEKLLPVIHRAIAAGADLPEAEVEELVRGVRSEYLRFEAWSLYPDVQPFFKDFAAGRFRHVVLSNHVPELEGILVMLQIRDRFEAVFNSSLTGIGKPHREAFRQVTASFPEAAGFRMIGDSCSSDIAGAESAGIPAVLVRSRDPRARYSCESPGDLLRVLDEIGESPNASPMLST